MNSQNKLLIFLCIFFCTSLFANAADYTPVNDTLPASYYRTKSKQQLTSAIIIASVGYATLGVGVVGMVARTFETVLTWEERNNNGFKAAIIIGTVVGLLSIPLFISARKNRRKYKSLISAGITMENISIPKTTKLNNTTYPALGIRIRF